MTFYDCPKEHWRHPRTTNPVKSPFRGAAAQDRCGQALQEGGQRDSGHTEDVDGGREEVPPGCRRPN